MKAVIPGWLGCPLCRGPLEPQELSLYCSRHQLNFPRVNGFLQLLPPDMEAAAEAFSSSYRKRREDQGWRSLSEAEMAALPEIRPAGWDALYWLVRRQSYQRLMQWIERDRQSRSRHRVIEMGAGIGWLSCRLASIGHEVAAMDLSDDDAFGLGAAQRLAQFLNLNLTLVQGRMEDPPFQPRQIDLLVFNASLHYVSEIERCIKVGADLLHAGGSLIIMDSPVVGKVGEPAWQGSRKLTKDQLLSALANAGLSHTTIRVRRSIRWHLRQLRARLKGEPPFTLPLIIARPV